MQSAAGGTSQRLNPALAMMRSRSRSPTPASTSAPVPLTVVMFVSPFVGALYCTLFVGRLRSRDSHGSAGAGRKTDVSDAQWLQRLHLYGLLLASFRPKGQIAELRAYVRQRERLLEYAASHIQHMQKALTEMNLQLHHVVADVTGATGLRIIRAILAGERDPK